MGQRPEVCCDVRQYERKGKHYPMKLLPESSIEKTKRTESVWETETQACTGPPKGQRSTDPLFGVILVFKSHPTISLHHLCLPHLDSHGGSSPTITKLTVTKTEIRENSLICPTNKDVY